MTATYPAIYRDAHGEEQTVIENDGQTLRMIVRGVEFVSKPFGSFEALTAKNRNEAMNAGFALDRSGDLLTATIIYEMPLPVVVEAVIASANLNITIDLSEAGTRQQGSRDWADPQITLTLQGQSHASRGGAGSFEGELLQIQRQLPRDTYMKCCFNCAFSGYNPAGNGLWGMYCHRNHKEEYVHADNKPLWFRLNRESVGAVQETYLCPEFERWNGETGYRDPLQLPVTNKQ